jgi:hypothetical protein
MNSKLKTCTVWKRLEADNINGYAIQITQTLSSFNKDEIDQLEVWLKENFGYALISEVDTKENFEEK